MDRPHAGLGFDQADAGSAHGFMMR